MKIAADMHVHSHFSDGSDAPSEVVRKAKRAGLKAVCLTDHDTVAGLHDFTYAGREAGIDTLPGIEITCRNAVHVLGYGIDFLQAERIDAFFAESRRKSQEDFLEVLARYRVAGVMDVTLEDIRSTTGFKGDPGTLHIAEYRRRVLRTSFEKIKEEVRKGGICRTVGHDESYPTIGAAIRLIRDIGGVAVLAHPAPTFFHDEHNSKDAHAMIAELHVMKQEGLAGIEVYHIKHSAADRSVLLAIAKKLELFVTGGSDSHGRHKSYGIGDAGVDYRTFEKIKEFL